MNGRVSAIIAAALMAACGLTARAEAPPASGQVKPVAFTRLAVRLPVGTPWFTNQSGAFCITNKTSTWPGGQSDLNIQTLKDTFRTEFETAGLKLEGDPNNLFEAQASSADYAVAGLVTVLDERICADRPIGAGSENQKGAITMAIDWQLYSRLQKQILLTVHTSGAFELPDSRPGGAQVMLNGVLAANVKQLAQSKDLRAILAGAPRAESQLVTPTASAAIVIIGPAPAASRNVDDAVKSVVLIRTGAGEGSGALISSDGYILTAAHVVGDAPSVTVRWSDGTETPGEVVRRARGRDVALIKADPRGRVPLALRREAPEVGDSVFAIGAQYGQIFQSSVTHGVVSAERVFDGYAYLQSDVSVNPGNSGGPLLDGHGRIVGLTVQGVRPGGLPTGINLFVPARDAIDFLSLEPR